MTFAQLSTQSNPQNLRQNSKFNFPKERQAMGTVFITFNSFH